MHAEESARYKKEAFGGERPSAVYFSNRVNESVANGDGIQSHSDIVTDLDYEVELAVIIGKEAKNVPEEEEKISIFGTTITNDSIARTLQPHHNKWYFGRGLDDFFPWGHGTTTVKAIHFQPNFLTSPLVKGE
mgnify:CR=1 FL=1